MHDFVQAFITAIDLVGSFDPEIIGIVALSLSVSLSASMIAMVIGAPLGGVLAGSQFPGRQAVIVLANALLGLPPVVVGLAIYLVLPRSGPLGFTGLLFTPAAMVMAQTVLATPIVIALVHRATAALWSEYGDLLRIDGASRRRSIVELLMIGRAARGVAQPMVRLVILLEHIMAFTHHQRYKMRMKWIKAHVQFRDRNCSVWFSHREKHVGEAVIGKSGV